MTTLLRVIAGSADPGEMIAAPDPIGMLKAIVCEPGAAFAASIASRSEQLAARQAPAVSPVLVTVNVAALAIDAPPMHSSTAITREHSELVWRREFGPCDRLVDNFLSSGAYRNIGLSNNPLVTD